jgi:hypothetical protein
MEPGGHRAARSASWEVIVWAAGGPLARSTFPDEEIAAAARQRSGCS